MRPATLPGIALLVLLAAAPLATAVPPRQPLTFRDTGLYGVWNDYFVSKESPFDFLIIQAYVYEDRIDWHGRPASEATTWNQWLKRARANGKRVIAVACPAIVDSTGKLQTLASQHDEPSPLPVERFAAVLDRFFEQVDEEELYAITLAEENVFWNGQQDRLNHLYEHVRKSGRVPVYQWYTPSQTSSVPGLNYPNLHGDGWVADEYWLRQPLMEKALRGYVIQQKPIFCILWALPEIKDCSIPSAEVTFWEQYAACRKYNIPVAYYFWVGVGEGPILRDGSWDPTATAPMRRIFEDFCIHSAKLAMRLAPVFPGERDLVPWARKVTALQVEEGREDRAGYTEAFAKERGLAVLADASITGFAHLRWDSSALELRPRSAGPAESALRYCFASPRKISSISVSVMGSVPAGKVCVELADPRGRLLAEAEMSDGSARIRCDSAGALAEGRFLVTCRMSGTARSPGEVLAGLTSISVESMLSD